MPHTKRMFRVTVSDGLGDSFHTDMPQEELSQMIGDTIIAGVNASQKIEYERHYDENEVLPRFPVPEKLLATPRES